MTTVRADPFDLTLRDFEAYRCLDCNYVQTNLENMQKHLCVEHEFTNIDDINDRFESFTLLPAVRGLRLQSNLIDPNDILVTGTINGIN